MKALVTKTTGLWYEVRSDKGRHIARLRGKFKLDNKKITNPIAVGDWVKIEPNEGHANEWVIEEITPRNNYIARLSPRKKGHTHLIASNIDQALVFFTFHTPRTSIGFVDRVLVTLEAFRIPAVIVLNKTDLCSADELAQWKSVAEAYEKLGYTCIQTSLTQHPNEIKPVLSQKTTLIVGHSGTGKSTLINQLVPGANQEVNEVSSFANKGIHTTTFAEMFFIDEHTRLIDTPGIKELGLAEIEPDELDHYFPEMRAYLGQCKFHDCRHTEEPGCLIKLKVDAGEIAYFRYESYLSMMYSDDNRK
jgi:ribosome biogenesis GTPase